jgi:4-hydroxy-tetrahydrodipicolinate reductase
VTAVRVAVAGACGRMGRLVLEQVLSADDVVLAGALDRPGSPELGADAGALVGRPVGVRISGDAATALAGAHVVIDFSSPSATLAVLEAAAAQGVACVVGTTGFDAAGLAALDAAATRVPVVAAPNMSLGVQVLAHVLREALALLGDGFDIEVIEAHHREKKDAPSGTALRLVDVALQARALSAETDLRHGRHGANAKRVPSEIGVHAVRGGDIVGDHTVVLAGLGERLELTHRATSRAVFAAGALRAARWVVGRPPGRYAIGDVLGIPG